MCEVESKFPVRDASRSGMHTSPPDAAAQLTRPDHFSLLRSCGPFLFPVPLVYCGSLPVLTSLSLRPKSLTLPSLSSLFLPPSLVAAPKRHKKTEIHEGLARKYQEHQIARRVNLSGRGDTAVKNLEASPSSSLVCIGLVYVRGWVGVFCVCVGLWFSGM